MSWQDVLKIIATAIASVGGAGAIVWALSSFFGKMWANKLLEKQKAEYQKDIEEYKSALSCELENVRATNEKLTYISKVQYDLEISAIKDLTRESYSLLMICYSVIPFDKAILNNSQEIILRNKNYFNRLTHNMNNFMDVLGGSLAFIEDDILDRFNNFLCLCREQFNCYVEIYNPNVGIPAKKVDLLFDRYEEISKTFNSAIKATKEYLKKIQVSE